MGEDPGAFVLHPELKRLFQLWLGWSKVGSIPARRDIDPLVLKPLLPSLQLLDLGETPEDLRYRLVGGDITATIGFEHRGMTRADIRRTRVLAKDFADFDLTSFEMYDTALRSLVSYTHGHVTSYDRDELACARLLLPISEDGLSIPGILGGMYMSSDNSGFWADFIEHHVEMPIETFGLKVIRGRSGS